MRDRRALIPGGSSLFSKLPELYCDGWPEYYLFAQGVKVGALKRSYVDMSTMGMGACILGYAHPGVEEKVLDAVQLGSVSSLNCFEEVELAETLLDMHPWASWARFARGGGEAIAMAVRIARAATGRDLVVGCGYHGWLLPLLEEQAVGCADEDVGVLEWGDSDEVEFWAAEQPAAFVVEPCRSGVDVEFICELAKQARDCGAVLIFDEITTGFRARYPGFSTDPIYPWPDMVVYAKAMSNGYPMSAVVGAERLRRVVERCWLSSTAWSERIGPAAALATIEALKEKDYEQLYAIGRSVKEVWTRPTTKVSGPDYLPSFEFLDDPDRVKQTIFTQQMLERGFLAWKQFKPSFAHTQEHVAKFAEAAGEVFDGIERGRFVLKGPPAREGFRRIVK